MKDSSWIEWKGGKRPVGEYDKVTIRLANGYESSVPAMASLYDDGGNWRKDIIAYRLHKPEQSKSTAVGDDETNLAAKEELEPEPEASAGLTIEQLAADYRAKLAIAQRAQEEADSHRCGVEAALSRLQLAGWSIGLSISPQADGPKSEPESEPLNITDWRDLRVGDVISWLSYDPHYKYDECEIIKVESAKYDGTKTILIDVGNNNHYWVDVKDDSWRFIRRP